MKRLNQVSSLFLAGFSVLIIIFSLKLGVGNVKDPGPGFMGFLASILLLILSFIIFIKDFYLFAKKYEDKSAISRERLTKPFILAITLCGYAFILRTAGYLISTFFLMFIMLFLYNPRKWYSHVVIALIIVNASYLLFYKWLSVLLPAGRFNLRW